MPNPSDAVRPNSTSSGSSGSSSVGSLPAIDKLDGSADYTTWKFLMELYLIHEELWEYTSTTPNESDVAGTKRDQRARAKICLMVRPHCLVHVRHAKTAKEAWDALRLAFEDKGLNNRCRLLSKLVSLKLEQFATVRDYVTTVKTVAQQLRDLGKEVDDELLAALMLQGLTETFQPMRLAIENSKDTLTTDYVAQKLFQMEDSYNSSSSTANPASALQAKCNKKKSQRKTSRPIKCFICNGPHKARDCPKNTTQAMMSLALGAIGKQEPEEWFLDSGASSHMTHKREWLSDYKKLNDRVEVACANGGRVHGEGVGDVIDEGTGMKVRGAMYVPGLAAHLLSVSTIASRDRVLVFDKVGFKILKAEGCKVSGDVTHAGPVENGVYKVQYCLQEVALAATASNSDQLILWHRRLGHLGVRNLTLLMNKMAKGVSFTNTTSSLECEACVMGKQTKQPFKKTGATRAKDVLELVHTDVCGPISEKSFGGYRYYLTFIDDFTRKTFVYFLRSKGEVFEKFAEFVKLTERQTEKKLKIIRSDNGKEYVNKRMDEFCKARGIRHQLTVEYTPEQNGVAERANRTIMEKARTMLEEADLPRRAWAEAVNTAVFLKNRSPTIAVKDMTPEEAWTGKKIDLSFLKVFGCKAYLHVPDAKRKKLDPKSKQLAHVGYCDETKGYRLLDPITGELHKGRDVVFFENKLCGSKKKAPTEQAVPLTDFAIPLEDSREMSRVDEAVNASEQEESTPDESEACVSGTREVAHNDDEWESPEEGTVTGIHQEETEENETSDSGRRYPLRDRKARLFPDCVTYKATHNATGDPLTVEEALSRPDSEKWKVAIEEELSALKKNKTWILTKRPQSCNVVDSKWLFRIKEEGGNTKRYKARLVARGFSQRYGEDYDETYSPVVRHSSLRLLLALAAKSNLNVDQMDVKTAFLNGELKETVYMKQPEGFEEMGDDYGAVQEIKILPNADEDKLKFNTLCSDPESDATEEESTPENLLMPDTSVKGEKGDKGDQGEVGPQGPLGPRGPPGSPGIKGNEGTCACSESVVSSLLKKMPEMRGPPGERGLQGETGDPGKPGNTGKQGDQGERGPQGLKGETGERGDDGSPGKDGDPGSKGEPGKIGDPGPPGLQGPPGPPGPPGAVYEETDGAKVEPVPGEKGDLGPTGPPGPKGIQGEKGEKGHQGDKGEKGDQGHHGLQGSRGEKGERGESGINGSPGEPGKHAKPAEKGEKGDTGDKGDTGSPGIPATLRSLLDPKTDPVENEEIIEKLRGYKGDIGKPGEKGDKGGIGHVGPHGPPGKDGRHGSHGERGPKGDIGPRGLKGEPGDSCPSGNVSNSNVTIVKGDMGERGPPGKPGVRGPQGHVGKRGQTGPSGPRGLKGDTGPMGMEGRPGEKGSMGQKGEKGEVNLSQIDMEKLKGEKGEKGTDGRPGEDGKPGSPGVCQASCRGHTVQGPPGPPGPPGVSVTGPKGEPGGILSEKTLYSFIDGNDKHGNRLVDDDDFYTALTVVYKTVIALVKHTSNTPLGTLAYVLRERTLLLRVENGWQYVEMGSLMKAPDTMTTFKPPPSRLQDEVPTKRSPPGLTVIRLVALNEPYAGNMLSFNNRIGRNSANYECYLQAKNSGVAGNFVAFLASKVEDLRNIVKIPHDKVLPVVNLHGDNLFRSWQDMFNGHGAQLDKSANIYSFSGKNVFIDPTWPEKVVWHGGDLYGTRSPQAFCDEWQSVSQSEYGAASPLQHYKLLGQDKYPCDSKLIVLCVDATAARRRQRHVPSRHRARSNKVAYSNRLPRS